jgi:hypothetical protein
LPRTTHKRKPQQGTLADLDAARESLASARSLGLWMQKRFGAVVQETRPGHLVIVFADEKD